MQRTGSSRAHAAAAASAHTAPGRIVVMSAASEKALIRDNVHYWVLFWRVYMNKGWQDKQSVLLSSSVRWFAGLVARSMAWMQPAAWVLCQITICSTGAERSHVQHQGAKLFCPSHFYSISQQNGINSTLYKHTHTRAFVTRMRLLLLLLRLTSFAGIRSYAFWELDFKRASQFQSLIFYLIWNVKGTTFTLNLKIYLLLVYMDVKCFMKLLSITFYLRFTLGVVQFFYLQFL